MIQRDCSLPWEGTRSTATGSVSPKPPPPLGRHTGRNGERGERVSDFEQVYRENADIVYRYLFSLSHDRDLSEDLTQQTFCEALRHAGKYRGESAMSTYLCGIAKNLLRREWARQARRRHVPLEEAEDLPAPESADPGRLGRRQRSHQQHPRQKNSFHPLSVTVVHCD